MVRHLSFIFFLLSMAACAPATRVANQASAISAVRYAATPWDVMQTLVEVVPNYTPVGTHGSLQVTYFSETRTVLEARPVQGVIAYDRDVVPFTITVSANPSGDVTEAVFRLRPVDYETAKTVRDKLVQLLDVRLRRSS